LRFFRVTQRGGGCLGVFHHGLEMNGAAEGVKHRLVEHFRKRRMREDGVHQIGLGGFQGLATT
jgi:hypothetical protein